MLCHITDSSQAAEAISWPAARSPGSAGNRPPTPVRAPAKADVSPPPEADLLPAAVVELERRLGELDRRRLAEIAETRRTALEEGLRQGRDEASIEVQKSFDQVARALHDLSNLKGKIRREAEAELVKLSLAVARRILYRELSTDPASIEGIVHAALQKLQHREASRVRVYPAAAPAVRAALDRIGSRNGIDVVPDPSLETGALLFETAVGDLDASIETQLLEIQRGFADRLAIR